MSVHEFYELSDELECSETEEQLKIVCNKFCGAVGFEYYLYAVCQVTSLSAPQIHSISNYPDDWFRMYFDEEMQKHDPVVKYCFENTTPIRWDKLVGMEQYFDEVGVEIMRRAGEFGLVNGLSIPLKAPSGEVAIFSLATNNAEKIEERLLEVLPYAQLFGTRIFDIHSRLRQPMTEAKAYRLTARELECLFWACEGKTTWEISKIVDVTERTIIFHLASATKKLGATSRQHAVAKAIICGLIKPTL